MRSRVTEIYDLFTKSGNYVEERFNVTTDALADINANLEAGGVPDEGVGVLPVRCLCSFVRLKTQLLSCTVG